MKFDKLHIGSLIALALFIAGAMVSLYFGNKEVALALISLSGGVFLPQPLRKGQPE